MSKAALIFCETIGGHRQTYAAVIGRILAEMGFDVTVAFDSRLSRGCTALLELAARRGIVRCLPYDSEPGASAIGPLLYTERQVGPELTVIPAGDEVCPRLMGLGERGRPAVSRIPVFIRFDYLYGPATIQGPPLFRWRRWAQWFASRELFLRRTVWREVGAVRCLSAQPRCFALPRSAKWTLVPEIYRAWGFEEGETPESAALCDRIREFARSNGGRDILLYYGLYQQRRGYDDLLRLAIEDGRYAVLFFGRWESDSDSRRTEAVRADLAGQGRLLELDVPYGPETPALDEAFRSCRIVPLPYERHYNMSGTLIQASSYGIPVLVPDIGVMAHTVRKLRLGWLYRHGSYTSFRDRLADALRSDPESYGDACRKFADGHCWEAVRQRYSAALAT